jgi:hypothetical protein
MEQFLKHILFFLLFIILLAYPLDILISNHLNKSNYAWGEYSTWNDLYNGQINSEIVIYGSSRAWRHIDPELLEKSFCLPTYNMGIDGHNFWLQYLRHKTLLKYNKNPKYIILSIDIWSLAKNNELYNSNQFLPYMLNNSDIIDFTSSYKGFTTLDYHLPLIRYFGNKRAVMQSIENTFFFPSHATKRKKGFQGADLVWNDDLYNAKKNTEYYEAQLDPTLIELFENFLLESKKFDIEVILVYTPEYIDGQKFVKNRKEIVTLFKKFSQKYDILFLDYSNAKICTKKEYFYNASHLNKTGAELFTNILIKDLESTIEQNPIRK